MKFISCDIEHRYLRKLSEESLDIEFTDNFNEIRNSDKSFIIWNNYGYLAYNSSKYINKANLYKELKAKGKEAYIVERGALPNSIFIDRHGFLCDSTSYNEENWNKELTKEQQDKTIKYIDDIITDGSSLEPQEGRISREQFERTLNLKKVYDRVVFVPMQLHNDTVMTLWADWIEDLKNFIDLTYRLAKKYPNVLFLVKNHPVEKDKDYHVTTERDNLIVIDNYHYKDCISYSDIVMSINSGVGLQSMIWNKPTILLGKCFYQFEGINYKANNEKEVEDLLFNACKPNLEKVLKFIHYLRFVFYSVCFMKKLSGNASEPQLFEQITYEDNKGERIYIEKKKEKDKQLEVLFDLIDKLPNYSLMKLTCLDCIRSHSIVTDKERLYIGTNISDIPSSILVEYKYDKEKQTLEKNGILVYLEPMPKATKIMSLYGEKVNVPIPVVKYLRTLYGKQWQTRKIKKTNVVQSFNLHGWIFEFESLYYKKHSNLNVIPMLETNLRKCNQENTDIVVIPSAWHYRDLHKGEGGTHKPIVKRMEGTIDYLKEQGIKIVAQYNSHIEFPYKTPDADLIVASSQKIYDYLKQTYNYDNMIFLPHFIDTDYFVPYGKYNDFKLGWTGNFNNIYKRSHLLEKIDYPVHCKKDYKESLKRQGKQEGMVDFYNDIDVLIVTSKSEGSPMPILEAMSCGKVILSTDVGIASLVLNPEFIVHGDTEEEIVRQFNKKIENIEDNYDLLIEEGKRNRRFVQEKLSWKKNYHILDTIYKYILSNNLNKIKTITENFVHSIKDFK